MKKFARSLCFSLALLMVVVCFVACGDKPAETTAATTAATTTAAEQLTDKVPTDLTYKDLSAEERTITFYIRNTTVDFLNEICCDEPGGDVLYEAIHNRNIDVENRLGVTIVQVAEPGSELRTAEWQGWNQKLATSVLNNTHDYDAALFHSYCGSLLATQNIYMNLLTCDRESGKGYIDLSMPWWNQASIEELTYCGALFYMGGDICLTEIEKTFSIFFNKEKFNEFFTDEDYNDLYTLSNTGKWTIDKMVNYSNQCYRDGYAAGYEANGEKDDGDFVGWISSTTPTTSTWMYAMGLKLTSKDEYGEVQLSLLNDASMIQKYEAVRSLFQGEGAWVYATKPTVTTFAAGNQMFSFEGLNGGKALRDSTVKYGVLPLPKYNEEQEGYHTGCVGNASMFALVSNLSADRTKMLTAAVEVLAAKTHNEVLPKFYETVLTGIYSDEEPDAVQFTKILGTIEMDFAYSMFPKNSQMSAYSSIWKVANATYDIANTIDSKKSSWETGLEAVLAALEDAADKSLGNK